MFSLTFYLETSKGSLNIEWTTLCSINLHNVKPTDANKYAPPPPLNEKEVLNQLLIPTCIIMFKLVRSICICFKFCAIPSQHS